MIAASRSESPRLRLRQLVAELHSGILNVESFCPLFEHTYNMELDKRTLSRTEAEAFGGLFEQVIWYSPFPDERRMIPNYRSEEDIARAVALAAEQLADDLTYGFEVPPTIAPSTEGSSAPRA